MEYVDAVQACCSGRGGLLRSLVKVKMIKMKMVAP